MSELTHFNGKGNAHMVDVSEKNATFRVAVAEGAISVNQETFHRIASGGIKKGDVLGTAQIAGIMGAKKTPDIIPMCHPLLLTGADLEFELKPETCTVAIKATVRCAGNTGVEMEALTAVSVAALTIYDMCKAMQKDMVIGPVRLLHKSGGKSGEYNLSDKENEND